MTERRALTILFADVSGSTRLFEMHGDEAARQMVGGVLLALAEVAGRHGGRVVKTIGDEIMCTFPGPLHGLLAATDMHRRVKTDEGFARDNLAITTRTMDFLVPQTEAGWAHRRDVLERSVTDAAARADIDSGKLYAPFRYGDDPDPVVGALHPDHAVRRQARLARGEFLIHDNLVVRPDGHVVGLVRD